MAKRCKTGQILRKSYTTRRGVHVPESCIEDRGRKGKGPKRLPKPKAGALHGYSTDMDTGSRRTLLEKLAKKEGCGEINRKLNLVAIFNKRTNPKVHRTMRSDIKYMKTTSRVCKAQCKIGRYTACE